jgi:hypothetical protein
MGLGARGCEHGRRLDMVIQASFINPISNVVPQFQRRAVIQVPRLVLLQAPASARFYDGEGKKALGLSRGLFLVSCHRIFWMMSTQLYRGLSAKSSLDQRLRQYPEEKPIYLSWLVREVDILLIVSSSSGNQTDR